VYFSKIYSNGHNKEFQKEFKTAYKSWVCDIAKERTVYVTRPIPEIGINVPNTLARNIMFEREAKEVKIPLEDYQHRGQLVWEAQNEAVTMCGVKILNPLPYLCDKQYCYGSKNGRPLYFHDDHLSEYGNQFLIPLFKKVF